MGRRSALSSLVPQLRKLPEILSPEEVARLLEAARNPKCKAALAVAYGAGLRISEVVSLKVSDIDSKRMLIRPTVVLGMTALCDRIDFCARTGSGRPSPRCRKRPRLARLTRAAASRCSRGIIPRPTETNSSLRRQHNDSSTLRADRRHPRVCSQHHKHGDQNIRPIAHWYGEIYGLEQAFRAAKIVRENSCQFASSTCGMYAQRPQSNRDATPNACDRALTRYQEHV
jgi:integrase